MRRAAVQMRDYKRAATHYERASTAQHEVPRMLYEAGRLEELEAYVHASSNKELSKWCAARSLPRLGTQQPPAYHPAVQVATHYQSEHLPGAAVCVLSIRVPSVTHCLLIEASSRTCQVAGCPAPALPRAHPLLAG
jgi:hypothetical protein